VLACAIFFAFHLSSLRQSLKREADQSAQYVIESVSGPMRHENHSSAEASMNRLLSHNMDVVGACLFDQNGVRVATYFPKDTAPDLPDRPSTYLGAWFKGGDLHLSQQIDMFAPESLQFQMHGFCIIMVDSSWLRLY